MGWLGLEPRTNALKGRCSTIELPTRPMPVRESQVVSLPRFKGFVAGALPRCGEGRPVYVRSGVVASKDFQKNEKKWPFRRNPGGKPWFFLRDRTAGTENPGSFFMLSTILISSLLGYLLGSIPFGLLVGRLKGVDIRQHGSGNIGATNVVRVIGKKWGILVFALDALKGLLGVIIAMEVAGGRTASSAGLLGIAAGLACVLGHNFPVWLKFKGGKGVATTAGVLVGLLPWAALVAFVTWGVVFYSTRYVSVASMVAAVVIPATVWGMERQATPLFWFSVVVAVLGLLRHRSNFKRLLAGTEPRFEKKKK